MSEVQPAEVGEVLSGYRLESVIGRGGMGWVYDATHVRLKRKAAVKVLATQHATDRMLVSRFMQEARIASAIHHPNIVDVIDFVEQTSPPRIACVMELLKGPSLSEVLTTRRLEFSQAMNVTIQLASALAAVHKKGVTHRDLKPGNVIVIAPLDTDFSKTPAVKVCDFGIAKSQEPSMAAATHAGMMLGTPAYMSPEQIAGEMVGPETDLYALAEILCEMLTGSRLFGGVEIDIMRAKLLQPPPQIVLASHVFGRDRLAPLLRACLATERTQRPTLTDFKDALVHLLEESASVRKSDAVWEDETNLVPRADDSEWITAPPRRLDELLEPPGDTVSDAAPVTAPHVAPIPAGEFDEKMNTGFFYNRIVEDVVNPSDDVTTGKTDAIDDQPPSEPPPSEPARERSDTTPPPKDKARVIREARITAPRVGLPLPPPPMAIIRGTPVEKKKKRTMIFFAVGAALACGGGVVARTLLAERQVAPVDVGLDANPLDAVVEKQRASIGLVSGTPREHLARALELMNQDRWATYEEASTEIVSALMLDRAHAGAMGLWVENELSWREELLDVEERATLAAIAERANRMTSSEPSVLRAAALVAKDAAACLELVDTLQEDRARAIALRCRARAGLNITTIALEAEALAGSDRMRAEVLTEVGRPGTALKVLEKRLKADPKNSAILRSMAVIEKDTGKVDAAVAHLQEALSADGWGTLARIDLGHMHLDLDHWADAANTFSVVVSKVELAPSVRAAAYVGMSRADLGRGRFEDAKKKAGGALAIAPREPSVLLVRAEAELENKALAEAKDYAQRALAADPTSANASLVLARIAYEEDRADSASELIGHAVIAEPNDPRVAAIAFAGRVLAEGVPAVGVLAGIEKRDPGDRVWSSRRKLGVSPGAVAWAIERLRRADARSEVSAAVNVALAVLYYGSGRRQEATAAAERALAASGTGAGTEKIALAYQAQLAFEAGDLAKADRTMKELLTREPDLAVAAALTRRIKRDR